MTRPRARKGWAVEEAQRVLKKHGITAAPVPVDRIAKLEGATLQYAALDDGLSGMAYVKDDKPIIGVNAIHHPNRQRFTIAHEIAHLVLHKDYITQHVHVDKTFTLNRDPKAATGTDTFEIEANAFAAELLMPSAFIKEVLAAEPETELDEEAFASIAKKFRVSVAAIQNRVMSLLSTIPD